MSRFNFPRWNYGYTLGPPTAANGGNYTQFVIPANPATVQGILPGPLVQPRPPQTQTNSGGADTKKSTSAPETAKPDNTKDNENKTENPPQAGDAAAANADKPSTSVAKEEGEIVERPINEILRGRNPIMFCNDQSKYRNLHMEWEQVSETGPPHDKIFTWSLKMGEMMTMGSANSKKAAKNKAAEEMAKKLDQLPKLNMKRQYNQAFGMPPFMMRGRGRGGGRGGYFNNMPPPQRFYGDQFKKAKKEPEEKPPEPEKPLHPAQNNPISKIYEYTKKKKLPEPIFEVVQEEVLETRKTSQGFTYKKTKFTLQCEIMGKKFLGESMNKKTAKFNAAAAAWAEIGAGVGQASIDSLLAAGRQQAEQEKTATAPP